jgi:hypothetical protein
VSPFIDAADVPRVGRTEPRIFTPPLRDLHPATYDDDGNVLSPATSLGFDAIDFAQEVLGLHLRPWQRWLLIHMLELLPNGRLRFRTCVVLVARQNGKTTLSQVLSLFFIYVLGRELVIGTAQDLGLAEEVWAGAVALAKSVPELAELIKNEVLQGGKQALILEDGERYLIKAANRKAGRGLSGDLVLLDELREHTNFQAWAAVSKTTMARVNSIVLALSNAGDATSVVLAHLRKLAHRELGDPDGICKLDAAPGEDRQLPAGLADVEGSQLGIFEWSAPPGSELNDWEALAQANPSVGYGEFEWANIAAALDSDDEFTYRTEVMCQWADGAFHSPFGPGRWEAGMVRGEDEHGRPLPKTALPQITSKVKVGLDYSGSWAYITFAGWNTEGRAQLEVVARGAGVDWLRPWLEQRRHLIDGIAGQGRGALISPTLADLELPWMDQQGIEHPALPVERWQGEDLTAGTVRFFEAVKENEIDHLADPALDLAAETAVLKTLTAGAFLVDRAKSPTDVTPLQSGIAAFWLLDRPTEAPFRSAYEEDDLLVV